MKYHKKVIYVCDSDYVFKIKKKKLTSKVT